MENYRGLYKAVKTGPLRADKRQNAVREQKKKREDTFLERRNIKEDLKPSPVAGPPVPKPGKDARREKLLRWKAEKEKLVAHQKLVLKKKPPFKVGVAHHSLNPNIEIEQARTVVKCTTQKKAAAESRGKAASKRNEKPPTSAASSLASLSVPEEPSVPPTYSGRVTRSRTAAAAAPASSKSRTTSIAKKNTAQSSQIGKGPAARGTKSNRVKLPQNQVPSKLVHKGHDESFAPKDHKFKAPTNLTLPTTPLTLKRRVENWPEIPGVSVLSVTPGEPSSKAIKTAVRKRKKDFDNSVSSKTPKRTPKKSPEKITTKTREKTPKKIVEKTPKKTVEKATKKVEKTPMKSVEKTPKMTAEKIYKKTPGKVPRKSLGTTPVSEDKPVTPNMSKLKTGSGVFLVTEVTDPASTPTREAKNKTKVSEKANTSNIQKPKEMPSKECESIIDKENVPMEVDTHKTSGSIFSEMDPIIDGSRRMSIHEPSPPVNVTPEKLSSGMVPAQFSPFITSARGKDKYSLQKRRSSLVPIVQDIPTEELVKSKQIEHFRNLLERESSRLLTLSSSWEGRQTEAPPVVQDKILGAVGQARLLVKDKFQQFKRLIDNFEAGDSQGKMTADDLTGFWEMMLLTVENVDKRFKELEDLRENNWEEPQSELPVKKTVPVVPAATKTSKPRVPIQSRLKEIIEAARKRKQESKQNKSNTSAASTENSNETITTFDGGFFKVDSPKKVVPSPEVFSNSQSKRHSKLPSTPRPFHRRSLLQQVLTNSAVKAQRSPIGSPLNKSLPLSPSPKVVAAQLRASELGKRMSMDSDRNAFIQSPSSPVLKAEPTKSILKSAARKSIRLNTPRNRVAFEVLNSPQNSSGNSPVLSPFGTPPRTPVNRRISTPGSRKRASLIPRPIGTPIGDRASLMPVRESLIPSKPLANGELIDFSSPQ